MAWVLAGLIAVAAIYFWDKSRAPQQLPPGPVRPGYLSLVPASDGQAIYAAQMNLVKRVARGDYQSPPYVQSDIDQNVSSPKFVAALAAFQKAANSFGDFAKAGLPFATVRTDGVLDYATAALLNVSAGQAPSPAPVPPAPAPPAPPAPPGPSAGGVVPTTSDGLGNTIVTVAPGDLGTLQMPSAASAVAHSVLFGSPATAPSLIVAAPSGGGILTVASTNPAVLPGSMFNPANLGQLVPSFMAGPPLASGSAQLSVTWHDASGAQQTTTFTLQAA